MLMVSANVRGYDDADGKGGKGGKGVLLPLASAS